MYNIPIAIVAFITLYLAIVWLNFLLLYSGETTKKLKSWPKVTFVIPAKNEEKWIAKSLESATEMDYPSEHLEIIAINDASTDNTRKLIEKFINEHPNFNIKLINRAKSIGIKAPGLNQALEIATGELFVCVDADSCVAKDALKRIIPHFAYKHVGAAISAIKVNDPQNIYERVQRYEYLMSILYRKLMANIDTLAMTPGVLSIYRTQLLKDIGGFDESNITEDFEIALRIKDAGYSIELEPTCHTYTNVPNSFKQLWSQRIRWFRGFIYNTFKYKHMILNKKYKLFGRFQLPLNIIAVPILLGTMGLILYQSITAFYEFIIRSLTIEGYFMSTLFSVTTPRAFILGQNFKIMIPFFIASVLGLFMIYAAHKLVKERFRHPFSLWVYFAVFPLLTSIHWVSAIGQEITKRKRKW